MAHKRSWNLAREKRLQDRGALRREEGDAIREHSAMHEENFLSNWLRDAFDILCQGEDLESGFSWSDLLEDLGDLLD